MADVMQRALGNPKTLTPGQYTTVGGGVSVCCKKCGSIDRLTNAVDPGGRVMRAFACLTVTCGYREYLLLDSWGTP